MFKKPDVATDFIHLSQRIGVNTEAVAYEIANILENSLEDNAYKRIAEEKLIAMALNEETIFSGLEYLSKQSGENFDMVKKYASQILDRVTKSRSEEGQSNKSFLQNR